MGDQGLALDEFGSLHDSAPGIIAATEGPDHVFTYANQAYETFVGRQDLIGRRVVDVLPEVASQGFIDLLDRVYSTAQPFRAENKPIWLLDPVTKRQALKFMTFVYQPVQDEDGAVRGIFLEGHDVTAASLAQQELETLRKGAAHAARVNLMGTMAATLGHELNQPLAAISSYAGAGLRMLQSGQADPTRFHELLCAIDAATLRAGDIIRNIRQWTRRGETSKVLFDLGDAIADCVALVSAGGCFEVPIENRAPAGLDVVANRIEIEQVIVNLLRNACESRTPVRPNRVWVDASLDGDAITVAVGDSGRGLSPADAADVFAWADSSKEEGTGLGLAICRTIVEEHRGQIWVEQAGPEGCEFRFSIPAITDFKDGHES